MFTAPQPSNLTGETLAMPSGVAGVAFTVRMMRALVNRFKIDPTLRQQAINIIYLQPEKDDFHEVQSLFEFVRDHVRYTMDVQGVETVQSPLTTLEILAGDCDDQSTLLATLLESVGYRTRFVCAGYSTPGKLEHVYLEVLAGDYVIPMDPTEREAFGFEPGNPVTLWYEPV